MNKQILLDYLNKKKSIRDKTIFGRSNERYNGFKMTVRYTDSLEYLMKNLFNSVVKKPEGIAAFVYGSLGRKEMIGESDLDVLVLWDDKYDKISKERKDEIKQKSESFNFCKVDIPDWGNLKEAEVYSKISITEGNQVLECRFLCGDDKKRKKEENIQQKYATAERMTRNFIFQKFYFDEYFKHKVRDDALNIKYCHGGSREFLFINWFDNFMFKKHPCWETQNKEIPYVERGLINLYKNNLISTPEFKDALNAANFNILMRNETLDCNKGTKDEGLTYLDKITSEKLYKKLPELMEYYNITSYKDLIQEFNKQASNLKHIKDKIWDILIEECSRDFNNKWKNDFKLAYNPNTSESKREKLISYEDTLIKTALIWGASNSNQSRLLEKIIQENKDNNSWEVQASISTSPYCSAEHLDYLTNGIAKEKGYGYILRIIARNPNVTIETLKNIAYDNKLDIRYKQIALAALRHGRKAANHQI